MTRLGPEELTVAAGVRKRQQADSNYQRAPGGDAMSSDGVSTADVSVCPVVSELSGGHSADPEIARRSERLNAESVRFPAGELPPDGTAVRTAPRVQAVGIGETVLSQALVRYSLYALR
jgi:hypothetical protein